MTKRIISVLLALVLVLALSTSALAGTITINGLEGQTYSAWKMLDISVPAGENVDQNAITYVVTPEWKAFFETNKDFIVVDEAGNASLATGVSTDDDSAAAIAFTKAALEYAKTITPTATKTTEAAGDVVLEVGAGYYLVDSSVGSLLMMETNYNNATITDKNEQPDVDKIIKSENVIDGSSNKKNTASIGDVVNYETTISVKKGLESLRLVDTMEEGLTYNTASLEIAGLTKDKDYTVTSPYTVTEDGETKTYDFAVVFTSDYLKTVTGDTSIVVTYKATVNENATLHTNSNDNTTWIEYGQNYAVKSTEKTTQTFVFDLNVYKYTNSNGTEKALAGATFTLAEGDTALKFNKDATTGVYELNANGTESTLVSDANGNIKVEGLGAGTYVLTETVAPAGYNKLTAPLTVVIDNEGKISGSDLSIEANVIEVENKTGATLPETGGIGTTIFYLVGGLMMAAAVVLLVAKKRTVNE